MKPEFTIEQIRDFVKKQYKSVSSRYVKACLQHYDNAIIAELIPVVKSIIKPSTETEMESYINKYFEPATPDDLSHQKLTKSQIYRYLFEKGVPIEFFRIYDSVAVGNLLSKMGFIKGSIRINDSDVYRIFYVKIKKTDA